MISIAIESGRHCDETFRNQPDHAGNHFFREEAALHPAALRVFYA
jgi:hypothetical protein